MAPTRTGQRDIPTHLSYPLTATQIEALDAMLTELYRASGKIRLDQIIAGGTAHAVLVSGGTAALSETTVGATNTVLHGVTGADPAYSAVVEGDLSLTDLTTANVSTSRHGFVPKAPNDATKYLDGTGAFSTPSGLSVAQAAARVSVRV